MSDLTKAAIAFGVCLAIAPFAFVSCTDEGSDGNPLSVPSPTVVQVDGQPLTCVVDVGYSNYGGGVSCDWDSWNELKDSLT